jgi:hypothetical protein
MNRYPSAQRDAKAAIAILDGRHGWKLVPMEPTIAMKNNAVDYTGFNPMEPWTVPTSASLTLSDGTKLFRSAYLAMLDTAPDPLGED